MTLTKNTFWLFAALLATGFGCAKALTADEACTRRAQVACKKANDCTQGYSVTRDNGSLANCEANEKLTCVESVTRTGSGNTPDYSDKCTDALEKQTCADRFAGIEILACATSVGQFKDGTPCISSNQCSSSFCEIPSGADCGKCAPKLGDGKACISSGGCLRGFYCKRELAGTPPMAALTGTCAKSQAEGMPCDDVLRCDGLQYLACTGVVRSMGAVTMPGNCRKQSVAAGQPCNGLEKLCVSGLNCVGLVTMMGAVMTEGSCKAPMAKVGDVCDSRNLKAPDCDGRIGLSCKQAMMPDPLMPMRMVLVDTGLCEKRVFSKVGVTCGRQTDGSNPTCENSGACRRPIDDTTMLPNAMLPGMCVLRVGDGMICNNNGNIGPGCLPTYTCVLKMPGTTNTEGPCKKRLYETICMVKK
jgi:hypothetical protein